MDALIIQNCLERESRGWKNFVDRFIGLVFHVIDHICESQDRRITGERREELCELVFQEFQRHRYRILKEYRGPGSVSNYLVIHARRIVLGANSEREA